MSTLKSVFSETKSKNNSSKNPTYYNGERAKFIQDMLNSSNVEVRKVAVANVHAPTKMLVERLKSEDDYDIIKTILMHPNFPKKQIRLFAATDERAAQFDGDEELIDYVRSLTTDDNE